MTHSAMLREELVQLARIAARNYNLPEHVVCGLIEQESQWQPWAIRYEPTFDASPRYGPVVKNEAVVHCAKWKSIPTVATEIKARCTSWGLMQVMGQTAREMGFDAQYLSALCDPLTALTWGCKTLAKKIAGPGKGVLSAGLLHYNGGGDPQYADKVMARATHYQQVQGVGLLEE